LAFRVYASEAAGAARSAEGIDQPEQRYRFSLAVRIRPDDHPTRVTQGEEGMEKKELRLHVEELEQRIAPDTIGNPGNNNPPLNNTNNPGNEGTGGQVSTGGH
jgi:hypothetical protein